jgi:hypothetical protein
MVPLLPVKGWIAVTEPAAVHAPAPITPTTIDAPVPAQ